MQEVSKDARNGDIYEGQASQALFGTNVPASIFFSVIQIIITVRLYIRSNMVRFWVYTMVPASSKLHF